MKTEEIIALLKKMTLEEKAAQLTGGNFKDILDLKTQQIKTDSGKQMFPNGIGFFTRIAGSTDFTPAQTAKATNALQKYIMENTRLKIPVLFVTEATSGSLSRNHTLFPGNLNAGAMFDESLTERMGEAVGRELRATGENWALAPVVDTIREFRYGRYEESYGEDIYLTGRNGTAYVNGLQRQGKGVAATLKHFAAQGISDGGRNTAPVHIGERELMNEYIRPFAACIKEAAPAAVMAAYHEIDGIPVHASSHILTEILRDKLHFNGAVVSDGNGIQLVQHYQEYCKNLEEAASVCMNAGVDIELDDVYQRFLVEEVRKGNVSEERLNEAVLRVLNIKNQLGLFENPYIEEEKAKETVMCQKHLELSYQMACESAIMLKNEKVLPIKRSKKIGLVGPLSNRKDFAYGDYSYPTHVKEVYFSCQGMSEEEILARSAFSAVRIEDFDELYHDTATVYEELSKRYQVVQRDLLPDTYNYDQAEDFENYQFDPELLECDVFIAVLGETSGMGYRNDTGESTDRTSITLSKEQQNLLVRLKSLHKPVILVLANGKPVELSLETAICDGILEVFKTGYYGARAICDIIEGNAEPGGRLPVSIPKDIGQCPVYYSQRITGKKQFWRNSYLEMDLAPLYEFGFGLSYTSFQIEAETFVCKKEGVYGRVKIKNTGEQKGSEVLQLYVKKRYGTVAQPERELKWYQKVRLLSGEEQEVSLFLPFEKLAYYNKENRYGVENMELTVMLGTSSQRILYEQVFSLKFEGGWMEAEE